MQTPESRDASAALPSPFVRLRLALSCALPTREVASGGEVADAGDGDAGGGIASAVVAIAGVAIEGVVDLGRRRVADLGLVGLGLHLLALPPFALLSLLAFALGALLLLALPFALLPSLVESSAAEEAGLEEEPGGESERELADDIGRRQDGGEDEDDGHHEGSNPAHRVQLHDAQRDQHADDHRQLEHRAEAQRQRQHQADEAVNHNLRLDLLCPHPEREAHDGGEDEADGEADAQHKEDGADAGEPDDDAPLMAVQPRRHELPQLVGDDGQRQHHRQQQRHLQLIEEQLHRPDVVQLRALRAGKAYQQVDGARRQKARRHQHDQHRQERPQQTEAQLLQMVYDGLTRGVHALRCQARA